MTDRKKAQHSEIKSFSFALRGLAVLFKSQKHFRFHLFAAVCTVAAGVLLDISRPEWILIILTISSVLAAEAFNSALEFALDAYSEEYNPLIEKAKDTAAGAVLICAVASVIIGVIIFGPRLFSAISG